MASSIRSTERALRSAVLGLVFAACAPLAEPPPVLWAWDRAEDLTFLKPGEASVAALVGTLSLEEAGIFVAARRGPLTVPRGIESIAVVRIEAPPGTATAGESAEPFARAIESMLPDATSQLQLDFDATVSQRTFYRALLARLARPGRELSITALASWCQGDSWLEELPIDRAVPMLYRMGADGPSIRARLAGGQDLRSRSCRGDYGVTVDEPTPALRPGRRLWLYSPRAWDEAAYRKLLARARARELRSPP